MSFRLSEAVNPTKVFTVQKTMVTGRWDPHFHSPRFAHLDPELDAIDAKPIRRVAQSIFSGITPLSGGDAYSDNLEGVAFVRSGDFNEDGTINEDALIRLKPEIHQKLMRRSQLKENDVLFAIVGATIGKVGIFPGGYEANINQAVCAVRLTGDVLPHFLHAFFLTGLGQEQLERVKRPVARANINLEEVGTLRLPVLDKKVQAAAVEALRKAFAQKVTTEARAFRLLVTIDDVLLDELGILRKSEPLNTLESRIFRRDFSSVSGKRIDPAANWKRLSLEGGEFPLRRLRDVTAINPVTRFPKLEADTPVSFVPMDAVSDVFGEIAVMQTRPLGESGSYTPFQEGDVIWAKITPCMENGKSAVARNLQGGIGYGSTEFHVFRRRTNELCPDYLHHLLRLRTVRQHARLNFTGSSGHQRVDEDFFGRLKIPFPPLKTQESIAAKAEATKAKAKALFAEARVDLEKAKRDIEALILGKKAIE